MDTLSTQLGWTHFRHIIPLDEPLKRDSLPWKLLQKKLHEAVLLVRARLEEEGGGKG